MIGHLPEGKSIEVVLGFDYGTQNIGVAVGNALTETAQPVPNLKGRPEQPNWAESGSPMLLFWVFPTLEMAQGPSIFVKFANL